MKHLIFLVFSILLGIQTTWAQQPKLKNKKADIEVNGNCDMCKKRIEKAAYQIKGVKQAEWHAHDQTLHVIIDENKTNISAIQTAIAKIGHDTRYEKIEINADEKSYETLHHCCQYKRLNE